MSWAAIAVGVVSAGVSAYGTSQSNKRAEGAAGSLDSTIKYAQQNPGVFGKKLDFEAVNYSPLFREDPGYGNIAGDVIGGNQRNLPANLALTSQTNQGITADSVRRIEGLYPGFGDAFRQQSQNTQNFLRGEIPAEDRNAIAARRSEAISLGGGGSTQQQTAADLGLSRIDLMNQGGANLGNNVNLLNAIDPLARHLTPQSNFVDVGQAISSSIAENQFASTFAASERDAEFNASLIPDPQKAGMLNLMASRAGLQAANPQQSVLGNAAMAGLSAGFGAYQSNQSNAALQQAAFASQPQQQVQYNTTVPTAKYYGSAANQQQGITNLSGTGPYQSPYNPNTGGQYGQQGGLWSYFNANNSGKQPQKYSFQ